MYKHTGEHLLQSLKSKASDNLVMTAVAFQDHIKRTLLLPDLLLTHSLPRCKRNTARNPRGRGEVEGTGSQSPDGGDEMEYVLDPAPPPLTLGSTTF